ncbi:ABC transporter permease [Cryobacterium tagatosivorans]|nr:ABC transporter permease [Cryobacterium tagatosivorans]
MTTDPNRRQRFGTRLAAGPLLWLIVFLVGPLAILIAWSFQAPSNTLRFESSSLGGYSSILGVSSYWELLAWTIFTAVVVGVLSVIFAFPIAYLLAFVADRHRFLLFGLAFVPFLTSYVLRIFAWRLILGENGLLNQTLMSLGIIDTPLTALLYSRLTVIIVLTYVWIPWAALPIFVRLDSLPRPLLEAAADLGVSPMRTVARVVLPIALPGIYTAFFLVFIPTLGDFATAAYVGGTNGIMIGNLIQGFLNNLDLPSGSVLTVVLLAVAAILMLLAVRIMRIKSVTDVQL